jgi:hypothetical protein
MTTQVIPEWVTLSKAKGLVHLAWSDRFFGCASKRHVVALGSVLLSIFELFERLEPLERLEPGDRPNFLRPHQIRVKHFERLERFERLEPVHRTVAATRNP